MDKPKLIGHFMHGLELKDLLSIDCPLRHAQSKEALPDDDGSVVQVSGFVSYLCIKFRQKALRRQQSRYTVEYFEMEL